MFLCPECRSTKLYEHAIGPTIIREIRGINSQYRCTVYDTYWPGAKGEEWWTCGNCGWRLPATNIDELICYLEGLLDSRNNHLEKG